MLGERDESLFPKRDKIADFENRAKETILREGTKQPIFKIRQSSRSRWFLHTSNKRKKQRKLKTESLYKNINEYIHGPSGALKSHNAERLKGGTL